MTKPKDTETNVNDSATSGSIDPQLTQTIPHLFARQPGPVWGEGYWEDRWRHEYARAEKLRTELEKIGWMDEFLDADGAKAMLAIARDAVNADEGLLIDRLGEEARWRHSR